MLNHYKMFAAYNAWANRILYAEAAAPVARRPAREQGRLLRLAARHAQPSSRRRPDLDEALHRHRRVPPRLDTVLFEDIDDLRQARIAEDQRIIDWIGSLTRSRTCAKTISYVTVANPVQITQPLGPALAHFFNHQTHHRGQCHTILTSLGRPSLVLDLLYFLRAEGAQWLKG